MSNVNFASLAIAAAQGFGDPEPTSDGYIVRKRVGRSIVTGFVALNASGEVAMPARSPYQINGTIRGRRLA